MGLSNKHATEVSDVAIDPNACAARADTRRRIAAKRQHSRPSTTSSRSLVHSPPHRRFDASSHDHCERRTSSAAPQSMQVDCKQSRNADLSHCLLTQRKLSPSKAGARNDGSGAGTSQPRSCGSDLELSNLKLLSACILMRPIASEVVSNWLAERGSELRWIGV